MKYVSLAATTPSGNAFFERAYRSRSESQERTTVTVTRSLYEEKRSRLISTTMKEEIHGGFIMGIHKGRMRERANEKVMEGWE